MQYEYNFISIFPINFPFNFSDCTSYCKRTVSNIISLLKDFGLNINSDSPLSLNRVLSLKFKFFSHIAYSKLKVKIIFQSMLKVAQNCNYHSSFHKNIPNTHTFQSHCCMIITSFAPKYLSIKKIIK